MKVDWKVVGSIAAVMACRELTLHRQSPAFGHLQMGAGARRSRGIGFGEILLFGAAGILVLKILGNPAHAQQQMQLASTPVPACAAVDRNAAARRRRVGHADAGLFHNRGLTRESGQVLAKVLDGRLI